MQIAQLDAGLLMVFAFSGMTIIGAMLAGWSSANKFSLLGGLRAGSQMISYELVMGLTVLGLILIFGTVDLGSMVRQQSGMVLGFLPAWGVVYQPFAAVLFLTAAIAENKRIPFDLPEAESELIAGYYTEYSAMKMGLFMFAEFIEIAIIGALFTTLFLGGYNLPYMHDGGFTLPGGYDIAMSHGAVVVTQLVVFLVKVMLVCSFQILIRWSLPRFRYDQVLRFAWKFLLPLALRQPGGHRRAGVVAPGSAAVKTHGKLKPYERKLYWNEPTLTPWERAYLPEILRGLAITSGVFLRNMTQVDHRQEGRADHLLPGGDPRRLRAVEPRQARADAAPRRQAAVHRVQHVRHGVPGQGDRDRGRLRPQPTPRTRSTRCASRSTTRAASSAACASRPAPRTRSAWPRKRPGCRPTTGGQMWLTLDEMLTWKPQSDVAKPYPAAGAGKIGGAE